MNGIFYVMRGGIAWRLLPKDLPPKSTVYGYFSAWRDSSLFAGINHHLVMLDRERAGREASPSAAVLDSQSVKTTKSGGLRGYDAGKKVKGRKRQALVDTDGRALVLDPQPAASQLRSDRASCRSALANQVRLVLHTAAYWLMLDVTDAIPKLRDLAKAEFTTLRLRLLKVAARVAETRHASASL